jgi:Domain of unknown function (DUF4263)
MIVKKSTPKTKAELTKDNPFATHETFITEKQIKEFEELIEKDASETSIHDFLIDNPEIFTAILDSYRTGNHAAVVIPKQAIRPRIQTESLRGLVPDFIIGGKNSDGWNWWVVELKGPGQTLFSQSETETYFNSEINKGICQLLEYIDYCSEQQSNLRDAFKLEGFREPNGILIAGRESELTADKKKENLKGAWNRVVFGKLEIRTYDSILRKLKDLENIYKKKGSPS